MKNVKSGNWDYEVYDSAKPNKVGIVLVHEIFALSTYIRSAAKDLSNEGYMVAAPDLYHGKFEPDLEKAMKFGRTLTSSEKIDAMKNGLQMLRESLGPKSTVGSMGFCFGGGVSLLAASNLDFDFCIVYYGSIEEIDQVKNVKGPILLIEGTKSERDMAWVEGKFLSAVVKYQKRVEMQLYPNAGHAFHNPEAKEVHNPEAAKDAWAKTIRFLSQFQ